MTTNTIIELTIAAALILGGAWLYWRGGKDDPRHGSQGAVILMIVGLIVAIHGSGLLEYRPIESELR